jgi:tetratricopeptide (TPR) repeat protein
MAEYFLVFISQQQKDSAVDPEAWLLALEKEQDNIGAALEWAIKHEETLVAYRLMSALWDYWYRRSRYARARDLADRILSLKLADTTEDSRLLRAKLLNDTGNFAYSMADLKQAEWRHLEALKIRSDLSHGTVSGSLNNLGLIYRERGNYDEASTYFNKALEQNRAIEKRDWEAINLGNLGINAHRSANLDASEAYLRQAASIFAHLGDQWGLAMTRIDLALTLVDRGFVKDAREMLVSCLADRWDIADQKLSAAALRGLAAVASAEHNSEWSLDLLRASLALSVPILDRLGEHQSLIALVSAYGDVGDHRSVARLVGVLGALRATTGLAPQLGEQAIAHAVSEARATLAEIFDSLESEGRAAAVANDLLDVENAIKLLLKDVDVEAVVAKAIAEASR